MKLKTLLPQLDKNLLNSYGDLDIKGISCNSLTASKGDIFVAIKGTKVDANQFINQAVEKGVSVIISDSEVLPSAYRKAAFIKVEDARETLAQIATNFYENPSHKIKVIGITGTNGKTTISYLLEHILKHAGFSVGVIGTINYRLKNSLIPATNTTPGPLEIQSLLSKMLKEKIRYCVMEVSSHALDQKRVSGIDFAGAIFTNLTGDHLDYFLNLENYFSAKAKLFKNLEKPAYAIINRDDKYSDRLIKMITANVITYAINNKNSDVRAENLELSMGKSKFKFVSGGKSTLIETSLLGRHNVYNILAAVSLALTQKIELEAIKNAVETFKGVPGRLEEIDTGLNFKVFVDFAHTADALKNVLMSLKELNHARIIVVFGCGGDRDKTKRPVMGEVASKLADFSVITSDNPRSENPQVIASEIVKGVSSNNYRIILDRAEAIKEAIFMAQKDDIILIAGKGHETTQIFKDRRIPFDDRDEARKALECLRQKKS